MSARILAIIRNIGIQDTDQSGLRVPWAWAVALCVLSAGKPARGEPPATAGASGEAPVSATVAYVSEVPYQWQGETGNPLELWARRLSSEWAGTPESERLKNLLPELSWERLASTARTGKAQAFVVHGYEFMEHGEAAHLEALLVPSRDGKAAMTEFVILRQRAGNAGYGDRKFRMLDLDEKRILVDRGGCGELVYRWLDREIRPETGNTSRDYLAQFRTASNAAEAVLAVYFGDVHACVVSRSAYSEVKRYNPRGFAAKLEEVRSSPPLLKYIIACPKDMTPPRRKALVKSAASIELIQPDGVWTLTAPRPDDCRNLSEMIREWQEFFGARDHEADEVPGGASSSKDPPATKGTPESQLTERRPQ